MNPKFRLNLYKIKHNYIIIGTRTRTVSRLLLHRLYGRQLPAAAPAVGRIMYGRSGRTSWKSLGALLACLLVRASFSSFCSDVKRGRDDEFLLDYSSVQFSHAV